MSAKTNLIGLRIDDVEMERLKNCTAKVQIESVTLARAALSAVLDFIEENGYITMPLQIVPLNQPPKSGSTAIPAAKKKGR